MRVSLAIVCVLVAASASAHLIVDLKVSVHGPAFVAAGQPFTYEIVVDDLANDNARRVGTAARHGDSSVALPRRSRRASTSSPFA